MNKGMIKVVLNELLHYGFSETYFHIAWRLSHSGANYKKFLNARESKVEKNSSRDYEDEINFLYRQSMGFDVNFKKPLRFTEKIQYLKAHDSTDLKTMLADKLLVRDWVSKKIGSKYLIPLVASWNDAEDIAPLNEPVCIKANHGSAMNYLVKNWERESIDDIKEIVREWIHSPFWALYIEPHYKNIPRKIIAEKYIEEIDGNLFDYKIHCFNGKPIFVQCIGDRDIKRHTGHQSNFDMDWKKLDWIFEDYPNFEQLLSKPKCFEEMREVSSILSQGFPYVRVDLYDIDGKIYFGEMTFTPAGGFYPYKGSWTEKRDLSLGELIKI